MATAEHHHHHHHAHHQQTDGARSNLIENIYTRTHRVLRSSRKLRREGYQWDEISDQGRIKLIRDEIAEIEQRLGSTGKFDELRPLQQEFFINRFAHEQDKLFEPSDDHHDEHSHGEDCSHDHTLLNRFIKNPKVKRVAAGILCQFDCTIPAALNIVGALFGGAHGVAHHDVVATLTPKPHLIVERQGKTIGTLPLSGVLPEEVEQSDFFLSDLDQKLTDAEGYLGKHRVHDKIVKPQTRKETRRQIDNETR